ncbi:MAG: exodeoxyribonuclease III [Methylococcaceae bacterium]|nr:exodeoxyribonuclease III [Methylococcaceae bacterium]MDD1609532.1 exodeoxyribonuclease III [Methylococcaceae bacterium]MDD1616600.1 exodeoxyribonuclease III [Methylococcaceae bacterium]OYV17324.1 MAG: exodeoxyribonuclease III [Methylococcaceae bacterium NSP1-2]
MRIITLNANGIRSAERKGFFTWMQQQDADIICLQETKAQTHQLDTDIFCPENYHCFYHDAEKKGYSGVALYCKKQPDQLINGLGWTDIDSEGRFIEAQFGQLSVISLYLPSGSSGEERQVFKFSVLDRLLPYLQQRVSENRDFIICGDWNIAHQAIDLKNWRGNQKNSGFLPEERAWLDKLFTDGKWVDAFRVINQQAEQYTWWSNRGQAWAKNVGWRIDYQIISESLKDKITAATIYKDERFSDHAPLLMDYDYSL